MNVVEAIARQAALRGGAPALVIGRRTITYAELVANVGALASRLAEEGVGRQDMVGIVAPGLMWQVVLTLAVAHTGAVSVPLGPQADEESDELAQRCAVKFIVHSGEEPFACRAPCVQRQLGVQQLAARPAQAVLAPAQLEPHELFRIGLSAGTTGRRKAVAFTHQSTLLRVHLTRGVFPSGPGDRMLPHMVPALHFALGHWLRVLSCGGTVVGAGASVLETLDRERINLLLTTPANATELLRAVQTAQAPRPAHLKALCIGGARLAPALQARLRERLCPNLIINYGMTEGGGMVAFSDSRLLDKEPESAGRLLPWVEMQALGADGQPLPPGAVGRLRLRSPCLAAGYVGADEEAAGAFRDGWFHSADHGSVSAEGLLFLTGREDVLNIAGRKVAPGDIEAVLAQDEAVLECVALTATDRAGESRLLAVVVAPRGVDRAALKERCRQALGPGLVPHGVLLVDALPHNEGGKIMRGEVAALVQRHIERGADPDGAAPTPVD